MLKVTLIKSLIAAEPRNMKTAHALGLRKIGQSNLFEDNLAIRGMIHHVKHLLKVEEVEDQPKRRRRMGHAAKAAAQTAAVEEPTPAKAPKAPRKKKEEESE